jgi:hypothetical protein
MAFVHPSSTPLAGVHFRVFRENSVYVRENPDGSLKVVKFIARSLRVIDRGNTPPIAAHRHRRNIKGLFAHTHTGIHSTLTEREEGDPFPHGCAGWHGRTDRALQVL